KALGLELGADDYVTKPFSTRELSARDQGNLRRNHAEANKEEEPEDKNIYIRDITVIPDSYAIKKFGKDRDWTPLKFALFLYLAKHKSQGMTREHLLETVWGYDYLGDVRTVDVTVRRLREKIEDDPSHPEYIMTRRGVGYFIKGDD